MKADCSALMPQRELALLGGFSTALRIVAEVGSPLPLHAFKEFEGLNGPPGPSFA